MSQGGLEFALRTGSGTSTRSTIQGSVLVNQVAITFDSNGNARSGRALRYATNTSGPPAHRRTFRPSSSRARGSTAAPTSSGPER